MKTIHIIEGIMSIVGKIGKLASKIVRTKKIVKEQLEKREEAKVIKLVKHEAFYGQQQFEQEQFQLEQFKLGQSKAGRPRVGGSRRLREKLVRATLLLRSKQNAKELVKEQLVLYENKGVALPLHRKTPEISKVIYLHQRAPTMTGVKKISKKRRTGT